MSGSLWCREHRIEVEYYLKRDVSVLEYQAGYITRYDFIDMYGVDPKTGLPEEPGDPVEDVLLDEPLSADIAGTRD